MWAICEEGTTIEECKECEKKYVCPGSQGDSLMMKCESHPMVADMFEEYERYDGAIMLMLPPSDWKGDWIACASDMSKSEVETLCLFDLGDIFSDSPVLSTRNFCSKDCVRSYVSKFKEFLAVSNVPAPKFTEEEKKNCSSPRDESSHLDGPLYIGLGQMWAAILMSVDSLFLGGGVAHMPGFQPFIDRKKYISLKSLDALLEMAGKGPVPALGDPDDSRGEAKFTALRWVLHKFGYNIHKTSKRRTVLAAIEEHEKNLVKYL